MLEHKQDILHGNITKAENCLSQIKSLIVQNQQESMSIDQQMKSLTPFGLVSRDDIYAGIRRQGALLNRQQFIIQKIKQLEDEQGTTERELHQYRAAMTVLDKRHYKLSFYLKRVRREYLRRSENNIENDIQEIAGYGRQAF
ncbi:type III secretion system protein [Pectobacterium parvum]|uniref:Type III secretion system protein n=2 Tax=Pectobacteriaceae TaxID=1903410 RepID=A0ABW8FY97_9GAMM|nr:MULTISPECIES: type III secretion system protein [Pectobacterium]UFK38932.1 type III secretion system protein [Pectobacterium parvum]UVD97053.1 type III secretion system protein [Pectobacterium parvum]